MKLRYIKNNHKSIKVEYDESIYGARRSFHYGKYRIKLGLGINDNVDIFKSVDDKNLFYLLGHNRDLDYYSINEIVLINDELLQDDRFFESYSIEEAIEEKYVSKNFKNLNDINQAKELIKYCWRD